LPHDVDVASAVEGVVGAAAGQAHEMGHHVPAVDGARIHEMRHAEAASPLLLARVDVDSDNLIGAGQLKSLYDVESDSAQTENHAIRARLDLRRKYHRTDARRHAAADIAG